MSRCPFAKWQPITGPSGPYAGGPFKIVHHTTEGPSAAGAFAAFRQNKSDPHFTVDEIAIYQHVDTTQFSRALKNLTGGVETNRDGAIQIEVVGFAGRRKTRPTLLNVARLCRWVEKEHGVPKVWPNGLPKASANGQDPGGHNRHAETWNTKGGHYGHSQVPENEHWDPGYTVDEVEFLMRTDPDGAAPESFAEGFPLIPDTDPGLESAVSTMPGHAEVNSSAR